MKIQPMLTPAATRRRLLALIEACDSFAFASAWVTDNEAFQAALAARRKLRHFVIGTHRYVTSVECLESCVDMAQVKVIAPDAPRLFHPKVYAFRHGESLTVYLGSSNLTRSGLANNVECGVFLTAAVNHQKLARYVSFVTEQFAGAEKLDPAFIASYRANKARVKEAQAALKQFVRVRKPRPTSKSAHDVHPTEMTWARFVRLVREDALHGPEPRLKVLARARQLFDQRVPFAQLPEIDRKCLAGLLVPSTLDGIDWGFFGQMSAFGTYHRLLREQVDTISRALDHIPLLDTVKRRQFDAYLAELASIEDAASIRLGLGTRLLTMKRPDQFVCIDNANREGLCSYFGVAPTTTRLDNYWERIVAPMRQMPWYLADMPTSRQAQEIWMGRAALLDAIYYDPDA